MRKPLSRFYEVNKCGEGSKSICIT